MKIDGTDLRILELLKSDGKLSVREISKKIRKPITTVHNRIRKLQEENVIKNYTIITDNKKLGKLISAYILVNMDYQKIQDHKISQSELADKLQTNSSVEMVNVITGNKDMILKILVRDVDELNEFIANFLQSNQEIKQTETFIVLH